MTQQRRTPHLRRALALAGLPLAILGMALSVAPAQAASRSLATQTIAIAAVEVTVAGTVDESRAQFNIELNTHSGDLANDLSKSRLNVAGVNFPKGKWSGDPVGGHHRSGRLTFVGRTKQLGTISLRLSGWTKALTFRWSAKGQPLR